MEPLQPWRMIASVVGFSVVVLYCSLKRDRTDLRLLLICTLGMTVYGMLQDQISVRMAPEYFTVAHPRIEGLTDPTLLGLAWGFLASWWGGMFLGISIGLTATLGKRPPLSVSEVLPGIKLVFFAMPVVTLISGAGAYVNGRILQTQIGGGLAQLVPPETHLNFVAVANAHFATYTTAIVGSVLLCIWIGRKRNEKAMSSPGIEPGPRLS